MRLPDELEPDATFHLPQKGFSAAYKRTTIKHESARAELIRVSIDILPEDYIKQTHYIQQTHLHTSR
jgi:hypothetical protein